MDYIFRASPPCTLFEHANTSIGEHDLSDVIYFVADNCSVNKKLPDDENIPLLGCNSNCLNLAVKRYLGFCYDNRDNNDDCTTAQVIRHTIIDNLSKLMVKLKNDQRQGKAT